MNQYLSQVLYKSSYKLTEFKTSYKLLAFLDFSDHINKVCFQKQNDGFFTYDVYKKRKIVLSFKPKTIFSFRCCMVRVTVSFFEKLI